MAIKDDNDTGATFGQQNQAQGNPNFTMPNNNPEPQVNGATFSFHGGGLFAAPIGQGVGSEFYSKLKTNLLEVYKQANEETEIVMIDMDNQNEPALAYSCIVVALRMKKNAAVGVAYHILILEATGDKLLPIFDNVNGSQVEIWRVTADAMDDVLVTRALEKVRKAFPTGPWYFVDGEVVPAKFNPDDKYAIHHLALNAGLAASTELAIRNPGFKDINLGHMNVDSSLNVNIGFNRQQLPDAVGNPMRSDILINFASKRKNTQGKYASVNSGDKEVKVSEASVFCDVVWNPTTGMQAFNPWMMQQQQHMPKYAVRAIITNLASSFSYTPGSVLMALATVVTLRDDNNWIQTFRPSASMGNEIDITDIGALNIEANLLNEAGGYGTRVDTKADSFKLEDLGQLVAGLIQPGMITSLDCPEVGPQAWYLSVFAAAASGTSPAAVRVIYDAAQQLTNDNFAKYFPQGTQMFVDPNNRIHLGTWTDRAGVKRDLRDIDHIAVCNLTGERNPSAIRDWSDTFLRTQYPLVQRLAARKRMISAMTNETAEFTGFAQRVTFSAAFMDALAKAIRETGLSVNVQTPLSGSDLTNQRGVATFANAALLAPGQTFMPAGGYGGFQQQFGNMGAPGQYRW